MELVKITNTDDRPDAKPLVLRHDGKGTVTIDPGDTAILPDDYATIFFGHPGLKNDTRERARETAYKKLLGLWGCYTGINELPNDDGDPGWDDLLPRFTVSDLDDERIWTVLDDPAGEHALPQGDVTATSTANVEDKIAELSAQVEKLTLLLASQNVAATPSKPVTASNDNPDVIGGDATITDPADEPPAGSQEARNAARDAIPPASDKTPATRADKPRSPRSGQRSK